MRVLFELAGAGLFAFVIAKGVSSWLTYRAKADKALREAEARSTEEKKDHV
jgi:hypothetical protein